PALGHRKRRIRGHRDDARQLASDERAYEVDPVAREDQRAVARSASGLQQRADRPGLELELRVRERSALFLAVGQEGVDAARSPLVRLRPHKGGEGWCCRFRCRRCSPVGRTAEARSKATVRPRTPAANTPYLLRASGGRAGRRWRGPGRPPSSSSPCSPPSSCGRYPTAWTTSSTAGATKRKRRLRRRCRPRRGAAAAQSCASSTPCRAASPDRWAPSWASYNAASCTRSRPLSTRSCRTPGC